MAEAKPIRLVEVDENFVPPDQATPDERRKAAVAQGIREGRRREKADQAADRAHLQGEHAGFIAGMKQAHADDIARAVRVHRGAARAMGAIYGAAAATIGVSVFFATIMNHQMNEAFDRAQEIAAASTLVGAATQRRDGQ